MVGEWEVGANVKPAKSISEETSRGFLFFYIHVCTFFNSSSSAAPQISLCRRILGPNFGIGS
jgi:hypothetical protein